MSLDKYPSVFSHQKEAVVYIEQALLVPGRTSIKQKTGGRSGDGVDLSKILKRTPNKYQESVLFVWLEIFSPIRGTDFSSNLKQHTIWCHIFSAQYVKVAEHSFQVPMPNSALLLNCLCFGAQFLQEARLTTEVFTLAFWLGCVLFPWQRGWLKTRLKNCFCLFKRNPVVRLFSSLAHYELTLNPFCQQFL